MKRSPFSFFPYLVGSLRDIMPVLVVILFFQLVIIGQPLAEAESFFIGMLMIVCGLALFVYGLELGVFPLGEQMARIFAERRNVLVLLVFAFLLGFSTTVAEPALIAIAGEASRVAAGEGYIADTRAATSLYAIALRLTVALAVGSALIIGVLRIVFGWPLHYLIIAGYLLVLALTPLAPPEIIGIAFDSGGITTSTITVPLVTALGVGLASSIKGRNPVVDGFGLIAFASLMPMLFVMGFGVVVHR